jgi:hypothetical protein
VKCPLETARWRYNSVVLDEHGSSASATVDVP